MLRNRFYTSEQYARSIGVKIGKNCLIDTRNWPSEPYLITIGDNVQLTRCVSIYTHGGANYSPTASRFRCFREGRD